jgi:predicted nucleic acid-binding protein
VNDVEGVVVLDTDTLSELSRNHPLVRARASRYLQRFGRLTITSITAFERLRGYHAALRNGRPFERQLHAFEALLASCVILPLDADAARIAASLWARATTRQRRRLGDLLIASIAMSRQLPLATRNRRDFAALGAKGVAELRLVDWSKGAHPAR